jgi:hypothetical protein
MAVAETVVGERAGLPPKFWEQNNLWGFISKFRQAEKMSCIAAKFPANRPTLWISQNYLCFPKVGLEFTFTSWRNYFVYVDLEVHDEAQVRVCGLGSP